MPEDDSIVEERLAVCLIRRFEDLVDVERLEPPGNVPTPDWRVTTASGRTADVEVIWATNEAARGFQRQFRRNGSRKEWPDARLSWVWDVRFYVHGSSLSRKQTAKKLIQRLIPVLENVEAEGGTPEEMAAKAHARLYDPASSRRVRVQRPPHRPEEASEGMVRASAAVLTLSLGNTSTCWRLFNAPSTRRPRSVKWRTLAV